MINFIHFIFFFLIKQTEAENYFDIFESFPLFNFELNENCGAKDNVVFHKWKGRKERA